MQGWPGCDVTLISRGILEDSICTTHAPSSVCVQMKPSVLAAQAYIRSIQFRLSGNN
eukprot:COSAG03_NODE_24051_length_275_cov_0.585227_1_plen_56_part_10